MEEDVQPCKKLEIEGEALSLVSQSTSTSSSAQSSSIQCLLDEKCKQCKPEDMCCAHCTSRVLNAMSLVLLTRKVYVCMALKVQMLPSIANPPLPAKGMEQTSSCPIS